MATVTATRKAGPARWSRGQDNVAHILPRRSLAGRGVLSGDANLDDCQFHILIVDPQPLTRNCLIAAMEGASNLASITAVNGVQEVQRLIDDGEVFDAVILNIDKRPIDEHGLSAALTPMLVTLPDTPLLLLASCTTPACLTMAFRLGVRGYLATETALSVTLEAIRLVCGGWMIYPAFKQNEMPPVGYSEDELSARLTPRQEQVLQCLATGMPNKSIAYHLNMSESTVKAHIKEIMQRLGAANRTQVVALIGKNDSQDQ